VLPYATIYNITANMSTLSNALGKFNIPIVSGKNELRITHVGCDPKHLVIESLSNWDTIILIAHHQHELDVVLITGEKGKLVNLEKDKIEYEDIMISGTKPIGSILDKISGVNTLKTGFTISKPIIQGMYGSRVVVLNNGVKQEGQQWGSEHGLEIDPYNTSIIRLVKGAEALRYTGDAIGGVLLAEPIKFSGTDSLISTLIFTGTDNGRSGNISASISKTTFNRKFGLMGIRLQGTLKRGGDLNTPDYYLPNTAMLEKNASLGLQIIQTKRHQLDLFSSWYSSKFGILTTSHIGNLTDLNKILDKDYTHPVGKFSYTIGRPFQNTNHSLSRAKWGTRFSSTLNSELVYGYQLNLRKEYDSHNYFNNSAPSLDLKLQTHQLDYFLSKNFKKGWNLKTGISLVSQSNQYKGRYFIPNYLKKEGYQFSILRSKYKKSEFEFGYRVGGLKLDVYKWENDIISHYQLNFKGLSWHAGWLYKLNHDWQLALNAGNVWRSPNISELFSEGLHHGAAAIEYGNNLLKPEHAISGNFTIKYKHNKTIFEGEFFVKKIKNYIYLNPKLPAELTIRGAFPTFVYIQTDALFYGLDFLLVQQLTKTLTFTEKGGLIHAMDLSSDQFINGVPPFRFEHGLQYKTGDWKLVNQAKFNMSAVQALKQNRYTQATDYQQPPEGYIILNAGFSLSFKHNQNIILFLNVDNLLNKSYRNYLNRFRYFSDELGRMTTLGVFLTF